MQGSSIRDKTHLVNDIASSSSSPGQTLKELPTFVFGADKGGPIGRIATPKRGKGRGRFSGLGLESITGYERGKGRNGDVVYEGDGKVKTGSSKSRLNAGLVSALKGEGKNIRPSGSGRRRDKAFRCPVGILFRIPNCLSRLAPYLDADFLTFFFD